MTKIIILYTESGGGHKSTALYLQEIINKNTDWQVELINPFTELCAEYDIMTKLFSTSAEDMYNKYVSENHTALIKLFIIFGIFKLNLAIFRKKIVRKLTTAWHDMHPSLVISVTPLINDIVSESLMLQQKPIPFATLVTDIQEFCRSIWITKKPQNLICYSQQLVDRALKRGIDQQYIFKLSGMVVAGKFYVAQKHDRNELSKKLGLQSGIPTALVSFGSHAAAEMLTIAKNLRNCPYKLQAVFICGYDQNLRHELQNLSVDYPLIATGFVNNVEEYMRCADVFIGKPGGLSVAEAAIMHLPFILKYNLFTLVHERNNAKWVLDNKLGISIKHLDNIQHEIRTILERAPEYVKNYAALDNRAYFEIIPILEQILATKSHSNEVLPIAIATG